MKKDITNRNAKKYGALLVVTLAGFFLLVSCQDDQKDTSPSKESEPGIHQHIDRGPAIVTLDIDQKEITIAERLHLTIGITVAEDYDVRLPGFGEKLEQFGIVDYQTSKPKLTGNHQKTVSRTYVLEPFLSGEYTIPPMAVKFWEKGEEETNVHKIETNEVSIKVSSLLPEDMKELTLNEIKPPVPFPRSYQIWLWAGMGVAALCFFVGGFLLITKHRKKAEAIPAQPLAHELAYEELRRLVEADWVNQGKIKEFYQHISNILRRYIENRFGLHAPEQTTEEFLPGLDRVSDFPNQYNGLLETFLTHCDLVKFAEHRPTQEDIQKTFDSCKAFIQATEEKE